MHRAEASKGPAPLLPKDWITLHNIGQKYIVEKADGLYWKCNNSVKPLEKKVEAYLRESKHRAAILFKTPRNGFTPLTQEVIGMFIEYNASKGLNDKEITPEQIVLDFKPILPKYI